MEDLILQALIKEAAAEKLLEEAELLKIAAEQLSVPPKPELPWSYKHPILASTAALTTMGLFGVSPFAIQKFVAKKPKEAWALLGGGLLAGSIFGGLRGWLISRELKRYKRMKELGII
jgi:hypothetical protein